MEEIITWNVGWHFDIDQKRLEDAEDRREREEEAAAERLMKVQQ